MYFVCVFQSALQSIQTGAHPCVCVCVCTQGQALDVALDLYEWLVSGREVTEPLPADIATYNTLIKACHQVCERVCVCACVCVCQWQAIAQHTASVCD